MADERRMVLSAMVAVDVVVTPVDCAAGFNCSVSA